MQKSNSILTPSQQCKDYHLKRLTPKTTQRLLFKASYLGSLQFGFILSIELDFNPLNGFFSFLTPLSILKPISPALLRVQADDATILAASEELGSLREHFAMLGTESDAED